MKKLLVLFSLLLYGYCPGQMVNRIDHFTGYDDESCWNVVPDNLGGYYAAFIFADSIASDPQNQQNFLVAAYSGSDVIIHVSQNGQLLWIIPFLNGSVGITEMIADQSGALYFLGVNSGSLYMDSTYGIQFQSGIGSRDMFLAKYNYNGTLAWVDQFFETSNMQHYTSPAGIALSGNDIIIAGRFHQLVDFDPGAAQYALQGPTNVNDYSIFLATYSQATGAWIQATELSSSGGDFTLSGLECSGSGKIFITGTVDDMVDFDPGMGATQLSGGGDDDPYIACYTSSHVLLWAMCLQDATTNQEIYDLAVSGNQVIISGSYAGNLDFDPGPATTSTTFNDAYLVSYDTMGSLNWFVHFDQVSTGGSLHPMTLDIWGNAVLVAGSYSGTVDLDPSSGMTTIMSGTSFIRGFIGIYDLASGIFRTGYSVGGSGFFASQITDICHTSSTTMLINYGFDVVLDADLTSGVNNVNNTTMSSGYMRDICIVVYDFLDIGYSENNESKVSLSAYPNPAHENISIACSEQFYQVQIYNSAGQAISRQKFDPTNNYTISGLGLPNGIYHFEVQTTHGVLHKSISIIHQ